ncbi:MAG: HEAT repeat domain-containing protein [Gammaproteobacteria bacterium]|nr:HEAT repeat domain-containing protein [Gammaproteobacteria bacterium]
MSRYTLYAVLIAAGLGGAYGLMNVLIDGSAQSSPVALAPAARTSAPLQFTGTTRVAPVTALPAHSALTDVDVRGLEVLFQTLQISSDDKEEPIGPEAWGKLRHAVNSNPAFRSQLQKRYETEQDERARSIIVSLLAGQTAPDVIEFARRLHASTDAAQRKDALELMASLPTTIETQQLFTQTLEQERDPEVLTQTIGLLPNIKMKSNELSAAVTRVQSLSQHENAPVRAEALQVLARLDRGATEQRAYEALADSSDDVRLAAIDTLAVGGVRSEQAKNALMGLLQNPDEDLTVRASAAEALQGFTLSAGEHAAYNQVAAQIEQSYATEYPNKCISIGQPPRRMCDG